MQEDKQLRTNVLEAIAYEPSLDAGRIGVAVENGIVTLTGEVHSYPERWAAERVTRSIAGVRGIVEEIAVNLPEHHLRTDTDIAEAALQALRWDVNVPHEAVQIKVEHGWLTLTGEVKWNFQRSHATAAVQNLTGVNGVSNLITLAVEADPIDVRERIERAFQRTAQIEAERVRIEVTNGKITLRGTVATWSERAAAEETAWAASGVTEVTNLITVGE
ncbi:MAG: BON domain-containing protein [Chloroflexi bacterium]|nr:BON domain-containing protein [Chloroflexota bacterium]